MIDSNLWHRANVFHLLYEVRTGQLVDNQTRRSSNTPRLLHLTLSDVLEAFGSTVSGERTRRFRCCVLDSHAPCVGR